LGDRVKRSSIRRSISEEQARSHDELVDHAKMLSRLPAGSSPARSEAAVPSDWRFTAPLCRRLSVELVAAELEAELGAELEAEEVLEAAPEDAVPELAAALEPEPAEVDVPRTEVTAVLICAFTRASACWLAMLARPVV
jgi:hypothetical protein